ncbi:MAG: DUF6034 family protein [Peptococcaceae bacterium]|nr:DUF6034 family protein [Peptococcaceae bacterium]
MRRTASTLLTLWLLWSLPGCQQIPENPLATQRGDPTLGKTIEQQTNPTPVPYETPDHWIESISPYITVKADVLIPDVGSFPIATATDGEISQETADKIIEVLLGEATLYEEPSEVPAKADRYQDIVRQQQDIIARQKDNRMDEEIDFISEDRFAEIKESEIRYISTPRDQEDSKDPRPANTQLQESSPEITGTATLTNGQEASLRIHKEGTVSFTAWGNDPYQIMVNPTDPEGTAFPLDPRALDQGQAQDAAVAALQGMGLDHLSLTLIKENYILKYNTIDPTGNSKRPCYTFFFMRDVGGIVDNFALPRPLTKNFLDFMKEGLGESRLFVEGSPVWLSSETAVITIAPEGIIGFVWGEANKTIDIKSSPVDLLPFEEIQNVCRKQILMSYDALTIQLHGYRASSSPGDEPHLVIDQIKLGMMRVPRYERQGEYWVIPVWDFYGYDTHIHSGSDARSENALQTGENRYITQSPLNSYLTLNALDGSIINRNTGF